MSRGILATSTAPIVDGATDAQIRDAWESTYAGETFVHLLPEDASRAQPTCSAPTPR